MGTSNVPGSISHVDVRSAGGKQMSLWQVLSFAILCSQTRRKSYCAALLLCAFLYPKEAKATVNVSFSASVPATTQTEFIANTTNQYFCTLTKSPFFSNTYSLTISSKNSTYQTSTTTVDSNKIVSNFIMFATTTYLYGWVDGQSYERDHTLGMLGSYMVNCSTPSYFYNIQSTSSAWHLGTCLDSLSTLNNAIYQQNFSTPTVIPGTN